MHNAAISGWVSRLGRFDQVACGAGVAERGGFVGKIGQAEHVVVAGAAGAALLQFHRAIREGAKALGMSPVGHLDSR